MFQRLTVSDIFLLLESLSYERNMNDMVEPKGGVYESETRGRRMKKRIAKQTGCILLSVLILLSFAGCSEGGRQQKGNHPFDFYIDLTTKDDIDGLSAKPCVEGIFPFTLMILKRPGYDNPMEGQLALLAAPSFEYLKFSPYAALIKEDPAIMQDPKKHPILISNDLAKAGGLSVGDAFYQETSVTDEPLSFTIAGIFRQEPLFAQFEAVALINDGITRIFADIVDEMGYTNAYIKASDLTALKTFLDEDFIPHLQLKGLSEEEIASIPQEELKAYYEEYTAHMNRMK